MLELIAQKHKSERPRTGMRRAMMLLRRRLADLRAGKAPLEELVVSQRLSREIEEYKALSPVARALQQLQAAGKSMRPGQQVRFVYTLGRPGVYAWDLPEAPDPRSLDLERYATLLVRAAHTVLEPFGLSEELVAGLAQRHPAHQLSLRDLQSKNSAYPALLTQVPESQAVPG